MKLALALLPALALAAPKKRRAARKALERLDLSNRAIKADSKLGSRLMAKARRLEQNGEVDFTWVYGYSIKFQGCHHMSQWNEEADGENEPRIQTKRLIRFRLCPTGSCTYEDASGCDSGYGDYVIDLNIFLEAYWENKLEQQEWNCEYAEAVTCANCENANNEEYCQYDCFMENGLDYCIENDDDEEEFEVDRYMECAEWDMPDNNNRRKLEDDEQGYFIGPYCSDQGGKVYLGLFTDEFCTNFADDESNGYSHLDFYEKVTGEALPYSSESLIGMDCISCKERGDVDNGDNDNDNNNDNQDEDEVLEMCEEIYAQAGKCESDLSPDSYYFSANENACNYIEGIQIVRKDGVVVQGASKSSKTVAAFIGVFAVSFVLLGAYVYYLKTKLDRAKIDLSSQ